MKHAYLIISHTNFDQLRILLSLLDHEDNDIWLHIDRKAHISAREREELCGAVRKSSLTFIRPRRAGWGGDSLMKITIALLREASKTEHRYYHLLSGADLPLKPQSVIHDMLDRDGRDFIALEKDYPANISKDFLYRFRYYYPLQNRIGNPESGAHYRLARVQDALLRLQKKLGIDRTRSADFEYVKGSQWFSITHAAARSVLAQYPRYRKYFLCSLIPDECFIQTIVSASAQKERVVDDNLRQIEWVGGIPRTFHADDLDALLRSGKLFARKFDIRTDPEIIEMIREELQPPQPDAAAHLRYRH